MSCNEIAALSKRLLGFQLLLMDNFFLMEKSNPHIPEGVNVYITFTRPICYNFSAFVPRVRDAKVSDGPRDHRQLNPCRTLAGRRLCAGTGCFVGARSGRGEVQAATRGGQVEGPEELLHHDAEYDNIGLRRDEAEADGQQDEPPVGEAEDCPLRPVGKDAAAVLARAGEEDLVAHRRCKGCKGARVRRCGGVVVRWCGSAAVPSRRSRRLRLGCR